MVLGSLCRISRQPVTSSELLSFSDVHVWFLLLQNPNPPTTTPTGDQIRPRPDDILETIRAKPRAYLPSSPRGSKTIEPVFCIDLPGYCQPGADPPTRMDDTNGALKGHGKAVSGVNGAIKSPLNGHAVRPRRKKTLTGRGLLAWSFNLVARYGVTSICSPKAIPSSDLFICT